MAVAGVAAAAGAYRLSLAGEYGPLPHVHAALVGWIVVAYVGCGLIAWSRRPESLYGPLLVAAGLVPALSRLAEADAAVLQVIGESLLLLPPLVFIHVFLAYPSGRLVRRFDRIVVITGYSVFLALDLVRLLCEVAGLTGDIARGAHADSGREPARFIVTTSGAPADERLSRLGVHRAITMVRPPYTVAVARLAELLGRS